MDIKEIAHRIRKTNNRYRLSMSPDIAVEFTTALLSEVQKQNEPVYQFRPECDNWIDCTDNFYKQWRGEKRIVFALPLSVEAIENKVAEACGEFVKCGNHECDPFVIARKLSEGEWRKHMKGE